MKLHMNLKVNMKLYMNLFLHIKDHGKFLKGLQMRVHLVKSHLSK